MERASHGIIYLLHQNILWLPIFRLGFVVTDFLFVSFALHDPLGGIARAL